MAIYSKNITTLFLNRYKELEKLQTNEYSKFQYIANKYRREYEMLRHIRNELSHNSVNSEYPYIVSEDVLTMIENMLNEVKLKAYDVAKKGDNIVSVTKSTSIKEAIKLMNKYNFSYIPILDAYGCVDGILSSDAIIHILNHRDELNFSYEDLLEKYNNLFTIDLNERIFYIFVQNDIFIYELKEIIEEYRQKKTKLGIILLTTNGKQNGKLLGIITPWDLLLLK